MYLLMYIYLAELGDLGKAVTMHDLTIVEYCMMS